MKLYGVPQESPTAKLIEKIEAVCAEKNLTLSRWQANGGNFSTKIRYAVHAGEREWQFRLQPEATIIVTATLYQAEGKTERSEAFRELSKMLAALEA